MNVTFLLYVDDVKLCANCPGLIGLQHPVTTLNIWCVLNALLLCTAKCFVLSFLRSRSSILHEYTLNDTVVARTTKTNSLGVILIK